MPARIHLIRGRSVCLSSTLTWKPHPHIQPMKVLHISQTHPAHSSWGDCPASALLGDTPWLFCSSESCKLRPSKDRGPFPCSLKKKCMPLPVCTHRSSPLFMLWVQFKSWFQEASSFQNPTCTSSLLCLVNNSNKNKRLKEAQSFNSKLFRIKSLGLDRIIDIWTLLQPEEERKKREYCLAMWAGTGTLVEVLELLDVCPGGADVLLLAVAWCLRLPVLGGGQLFPGPVLGSLDLSLTHWPRGHRLHSLSVPSAGGLIG